MSKPPRLRTGRAYQQFALAGRGLEEAAASLLGAEAALHATQAQLFELEARAFLEDGVEEVDRSASDDSDVRLCINSSVGLKIIADHAALVRAAAWGPSSVSVISSLDDDGYTAPEDLTEGEVAPVTPCVRRGAPACSPASREWRRRCDGG